MVGSIPLSKGCSSVFNKETKLFPQQTSQVIRSPACGFDAFELNCYYPEYGPELIDDDTIDQVNGILESSGIELCLHAPFFELNIGAMCPAIRETSIQCVNHTADLCHRLGVSVMVVYNGGYVPAGPPGVDRFNDKRMGRHWDYNIESLKRITEYAAAKDVTVCLENIGFDSFSIDNTFEDLIEIKEKVGPQLMFTLDLGHARLQEGARKGIDLLGSSIRHIHLTDNFGERDDHLPMGDGNTDFSEFAGFLKNFPYVITMEIVHGGSSPDPMLRAREAFYRLMEG